MFLVCTMWSEPNHSANRSSLVTDRTAISTQYIEQDLLESRNPAMVYVSQLSELSTQLPKDDQIALRVVHDATEIAEWASAHAEEHERRGIDPIDAPLDIHNEALPIHRLPNEILMKVFEDTSLERMGVRLQLVCRRWKSVMLSTPRFWANLIAITTLSALYDLDDVYMLRQCLPRSGGLLLHVVLECFESFEDDLFNYRHRISTLHVNHLDYHPLQDLVSAGMQNLYRLDVGSLISLANLGTLMCRQDLLPRLHRLAMPMKLLSPTTLVASLKDIELRGEIPDLDTLVDALRKCPEVEVLKFSSFGTKAPLGIRGHKVHLPHLRKVIFDPRIGPLLTRITFPPTTSIQISAYSPTEELDSLLSSPDSPIFRNASEFDYALVTLIVASFLYSSYLHCGNTADRDRQRLRIDAPAERLPKQAFRERFLIFPITTLTLVLHIPRLGDQEEDPLHQESVLWRTFPQVHTFELSASKAPPVWHRCHHVKQFMEMQGDERRIDQLTLVWEVPEASLSDLAKDELQKLEAVIRARHEEGKVRIETLRLHRFRRS